MIRFTLDADLADDIVLVAEGKPHPTVPDDTITSEPLTTETRALQARELVDAAAALIEDDETLATAFEHMHDALDLLPVPRGFEPALTTPEGD